MSVVPSKGFLKKHTTSSEISRYVSKQAFGNAMSVPAVGMGIAKELSALLNQNGSDALQKMFESGPSHRPVSCIGSILLEESDSEDNMDVEPDTVPTLAYVFYIVLVEWYYGYKYIGTVMGSFMF